VIVLAMDTCDARGSVAVLRGETTLAAILHETTEDYSSWLLPAVGGVLGPLGLTVKDVDVYAVASGPGSFTGLRVGLTTVKAWSEVYGKRIVAVSRLEALAEQGSGEGAFVAAILDAQREQVFGALYRRDGRKLERIEDEAVTPAGSFMEWVGERVDGAKVNWVTPDPNKIAQAAAWPKRESTGDTIEKVQGVMAPAIGQIGYRMAMENKVTDALTLDANYVRRSDAEIFWKSGASGGR